MGIYATFWHCHPEGLAREFLSGPLDEFSAWCEAASAEAPDDFEPTSLALLAAIRAQGVAALSVEAEAEAAAIDRLLDAYFGLFCDTHRPDLKRAADASVLPVRRFHGMFGTSRETSRSAEAFDLWGFMFSGRGVGRGPDVWPYRSEDGVYRLAYWTLGEVDVLHDAFGGEAVSAEADQDALAVARKAVAAAHERRTGLIIEVG